MIAVAASCFGVLIASDESGNFDLKTAWAGRPAVFAAVVIADRDIDAVIQQILALQQEWAVDELHAAQLEPEQRNDVAKWLERESRLTWTASLTDAGIFPPQLIDDWRDRQANNFLDAVKRADPANVATVLANRSVEWHERRLRPGLRVSLPVAHFVEFMYLLPQTIGDAVQLAIDTHDGPQWGDEFDGLRLDIDDSSARDAKAQIEDLLKPVLASERLALRPPRVGGLGHPIFVKHQRDGRLGDLRSLIGDNLAFVDSLSHPLCQVADFVAWTVHRYAGLPGDDDARLLYRRVRHRLGGIDGLRAIRMMVPRDGDEAAAERYGHLQQPR